MRLVPMSREEFLRRAQTVPVHSRHGYFKHGLWSRVADRCWMRSEIAVDFGTRLFGADLAVLFPEHLDRYHNGRILGCPDVIVEVLSDDSIYRDRDDKFKAYYQAGVPWYWIGDPVAGTPEEYHASAEGYVRTAMGTLEHTFEPKALPGLTIPLAPLLED
ncbi:MAG TPA: Uma2 family endonuclease [Candidatus Xenobia bacterium]|jgi:Uma2 family endonuclease